MAPRHPRALHVVVALTFVAIAVPILVLLLSTGGSTATPSSNYAAYPALNATGASGLQLVSSHAQSAGGERPTWPESAPQGASGNWPLAESIRKLNLQSPNITAWIAKSLGGGICVLLWAHQPAGDTPSIASSCSEESEEAVRQGATAQVSEIPGEPGRVFVAGVVPSTVGSIAVTLAGGETETVSVQDDAWSLEAEGTPQAYKTISVGG